MVERNGYGTAALADDDLPVVPEDLELEDDQDTDTDIPTAFAQVPGTRPETTTFKALYETSRSLEKQRVALGNRLSAVRRDVDQLDPKVEELYSRLMEASERQEAEIDAMLLDILKRFPVWDHWLKHVKGIGPSLAAHLLGTLKPPLAERGPSTWWKAGGIIPEERPDGTMRLPRARAGEGRITYYPWLRRCLWLVGDQFVCTGGYYRDQYDRQYARLFALHCERAEALFIQWRSTGEQARLQFIRNRFTMEQIVYGGIDTGFTRESEVKRKPKADADAAPLARGTRAPKVYETKRILTAGFNAHLAPSKIPAEWFREFVKQDADAAITMDMDKYQACLGAVTALALEPKRSRAYYLTGPSDPTWELHRVHNVARWAMVKLFTQHLWDKWLQSEGGTSRMPYVIEKLGHATYYPPPEPKRNARGTVTEKI